MTPDEERELTAREVASEGGKARAAKLSADERSLIAKRAAEARWAEDIPRATHAGELVIGDATIPCAVLDDQTRVLTQRGFSVALGRYRNPRKGSIVELPVFLSASNLKPFIDQDLVRSSTPIKFKLPEGGRGGLDGNIALGYRAELLPQVCNVYLKASQEGVLKKNQEHIAEKCLILLNGLATVGVIALVDEATGFQADRARDALAIILEDFISKELCKWAKRFSDNYYRELARLRGIRLSSVTPKRPQYFGHITNDVVYNRLAPGVLDELKRITPRDEKGRRKHHFHRRLTQDIGHPRLQEHLAAVEALMKVSRDYKQFKAMLDIALPVWDEQKRLPFNSEF